MGNDAGVPSLQLEAAAPACGRAATGAGGLNARPAGSKPAVSATTGALTQARGGDLFPLIAGPNSSSRSGQTPTDTGAPDP